MKSCGGRGQGLVEFALVVPVLLLLVIGIAEFGRAWMTKNIMTGAAREAVRIAAVSPPAGGVAPAIVRGRAVLDSAGLAVASIDVIDPGLAYGTITATTTYSFQPVFVGIIPALSGPFLLTSSTTMRREY